DFLLGIAACAYVGWTLRKGESATRRILLSVAFGFGIGLVSDIQSQAYFVGIFGGWGLLDGGILTTVALPLATATTIISLRLSRGDTKNSKLSAKEQPAPRPIIRQT
ncbi:MAG: hypothetical protein ACREBS_06185, partial [Nitrososphaerales archaeon]